MTTEIDPRSGYGHWTLMRERLLLLTLAAIQFTTVLDFLIIMPLGPQFKLVFGLDPGQFGFLVASYGIAAGFSGLAAGFFLDRFDRKKALLWLYLGFTIGTLCCAFSPTYEILLASRFITGAFGGVVGAVILAIIGDVVPNERRGTAMGIVMSSFSISQILGVPIGLYLAGPTNWHMPFFALGGLGAVVLVVVGIITPSLKGHMMHAGDEHPFERTWAVMVEPDHQKAFLFMAMITFAGTMIFPYFASYMVANAGLKSEQLPWVYFFSGFCTLVSMNLVGRWADHSGKRYVFTISSLVMALPILAFTNLPKVPLAEALAVSTILMVCMTSRMVPAMAMMTAAVEPRNRGGFMSINSAVQQLSMGLGSVVGGKILGENSRGELTHFPINGVVAIVCSYICIYLAKFLKAPAKSNLPDKAAEPVFMESV